jgi:hypothetical protein
LAMSSSSFSLSSAAFLRLEGLHETVRDRIVSSALRLRFLARPRVNSPDVEIVTSRICALSHQVVILSFLVLVLVPGEALGGIERGVGVLRIEVGWCRVREKGKLFEKGRF